MVSTRAKVAVNYNGASDAGTEELLNGVLDLQEGFKRDKKRRKTAQDARAGVGQRDRGKLGKRDPFAYFPLDMIHEILGHLTPVDLLNLARTTKTLRLFLMSKSSIDIWKASREAVVPPVPVCPPGMSEPQLAVFLFTKECTICSKKVCTPDSQWWILQLRTCKTCLKAHVVFGQTAAKQPEFSFLDDLEVVLQLIPGESLFRTSTRRLRRLELLNDYFRISDILRVGEVVENHQLRLEADDQHTTAEFEEFARQARLQVLEREEAGATLLKWFRKARKLHKVTTEEVIETRKQQIISKLTEMGYNRQDAESTVIRYEYIPNLFRSSKPLTETAWNNIKARAKKLVEEEHYRRVEVEEDDVHRSRRRVFKERYLEFKSAYDTFPDTFLPSERALMEAHLFKPIIQAEGPSESPSMFDEAFNHLPGYVDTWRQERMVQLAKVVVESQTNAIADVDPEEALDAGILSLATSVFTTCGTGYTMAHDNDTVHWVDSIGAHLPKDPYHTSVGKFAPLDPELQCARVTRELVDHVKRLVTASGLDPMTATIDAMDDLGNRFYCEDCSAVSEPDKRIARSWRNCIKHIGFHSGKYPWKAFVPLTPEDRAVMAENEKKAGIDLDVSPTLWHNMAMSLSGRRVKSPGYRPRLKITSCYRGVIN